MSPSKVTSGATYSKVGHQTALRSRRERWWLAELGAWLGSALLLVCIVAVLSVYDDKARPTLHWGITLNALIAVIIRVGLALLVVPLAAAMGQAKWIRVGRARPVREFAGISDAAHSPWMSATLLFRLEGGFIAAAGAILMLSMQGIETFVQQSVKYPLSTLPDDARATLPITDYFRSTAPSTAGSIPPDFGMKAAVYNGLFATEPNTKYPVLPSCSGVKCNWQGYYTLGFCNACSNITDQVESNSAGDRYSLPSGLVLRTRDPITTQLAHKYNASTSYDDTSNSGSDGGYALEMTFLAVWQYQTTVTQPGLVNYTSTTVPTAGRCTMQLCIRSFISAEFEGGRLKENQAPGTPRALSFFDEDVFPKSNLAFRADYASWDGFTYWLDTLVKGIYTASDDVGDTFDARTDLRDSIFQVMTDHRGDLTLQSLFDNVAASLTHAMRSVDLSSVEEPNKVANGTTYSAVTVVKVDWAWLSFPFVVWGLVLLYTIAMIGMSRGAPLWKDLTIATLCHGLDDKTMKDVATLHAWSDMKDKTKDMHVRLVMDDGGSKLSQVGSPSMELK